MASRRRGLVAVKWKRSELFSVNRREPPLSEYAFYLGMLLPTAHLLLSTNAARTGYVRHVKRRHIWGLPVSRATKGLKVLQRGWKTRAFWAMSRGGVSYAEGGSAIPNCECSFRNTIPSICWARARSTAKLMNEKLSDWRQERAQRPLVGGRPPSIQLVANIITTV